MYSIMIFISQMNGDYNSILNMPLRDFHMLLNHKAKFEERKNKAMEDETRKQAQQMETRQGVGPQFNKPSPSKIAGL